MIFWLNASDCRIDLVCSQIGGRLVVDETKLHAVLWWHDFGGDTGDTSHQLSLAVVTSALHGTTVVAVNDRLV